MPEATAQRMQRPIHFPKVGSRSVYSPEDAEALANECRATDTVLIIFCEFSVHRGPRMYKFNNPYPSPHPLTYSTTYPCPCVLSVQTKPAKENIHLYFGFTSEQGAEGFAYLSAVTNQVPWD